MQCCTLDKCGKGHAQSLTMRLSEKLALVFLVIVVGGCGGTVGTEYSVIPP
jgi:hypothetical protein